MKIKCSCQGLNENCNYCFGTGYITESEVLKRYRFAVIESKGVEKVPHKQSEFDFKNKSSKKGICSYNSQLQR